MASMASAASGFVMSLNIAGGTTTNNTSASRVMFPSVGKINGSRFVVRAADEAAAPATATPTAEGDAAPKPKPPPIGPKRGSKVSSSKLAIALVPFGVLESL